jgi:hypothetical protein
MPEEHAINRREDGTFAPGVSGNPGGRPKGSVSLKRLLRERLSLAPPGTEKSFAEGIVEATIRDALKGDAQARRLVWEYMEGRPAPGSAEAEADLSEKRIREMTDEELDAEFARVEAGIARLEKGGGV